MPIVRLKPENDIHFYLELNQTRHLLQNFKQGSHLSVITEPFYGRSVNRNRHSKSRNILNVDCNVAEKLNCWLNIDTPIILNKMKVGGAQCTLVPFRILFG